MNNQQIIVNKNLKEYEVLLSEYEFMRVHNSFLINLKEVKRFIRSEGGYIVMNNEQQVSISQSRRDEFISRMSD